MSGSLRGGRHQLLWRSCCSQLSVVQSAKADSPRNVFLVVCSSCRAPLKGQEETPMEAETTVNKDMKVEITSDAEVVSPTLGTGNTGGLARQGSITKNNCLCSPTTHAGSFRCRLHRAPSLKRTKSIDSTALQDSQSKANSNY
ncbi:Uncharacterized protein Fot_04598 [Forsythia ovata]|uniref:Uncharacterized protein n=1 Tax=Forsythia ovata TaxID=205694 RepID=A0ABD1XD10_9LAMI